MKQAEQVEILLIWVNAERQFEPGFIGTLEAHPDFARPEIVDRDAHQAEISAAFPAEADILEAIIDSLLALPDYDVEIQGAEKERQPTVVFRAVPLQGRPKTARPRPMRRHVDDLPAPPRSRPQSSTERILSTSEMAQTSGPRPGTVTPSVLGRSSEDDGSTTTDSARPVWRNSRGQTAQPRLVPLIKKIARVIFLEEEPPEKNGSSAKQNSESTTEE